MQSHASWTLGLAGIFAYSNRNLPADCRRLNAAGVGVKFPAAAWYLPCFQWSEALKVEPEEVAFIFCQTPPVRVYALCKSVSKHLIYYFSVYLHPSETMKSLLAPPSSSVHIRYLQGEIGTGFSQERLGRAGETSLSSVLKGCRRGLGNGKNFQQLLPVGLEPSWWLVLAFK